MAESKTKPTDVSVDDFLDSVPDTNKRADALALIDIMQSATGEQPVMWGPSIIGFGSYHYCYESGREGDSPIVGFSPRRTALVLYIVPGFPWGGTAAGQAREAHDRQVLSLREAARRRRSARPAQAGGPVRRCRTSQVSGLIWSSQESQIGMAIPE